MKTALKRILITGAAGCAGRHLSELAIANRTEVHGIVRGNISINGIKIHIGDLAIPNFIDSVIDSVQPEWIFHLAAKIPGGTPPPNPEDFITSNILGTQNLLEAVRKKAPFARILIAGSSAVYGRPSVPDDPLCETAPFQPQSLYAVTKAAQDMLAQQFYTEHGLLTVRARTFNQTGPGEPVGLVVATLAKQIVRIEEGLQEPELYAGTLLPSRDFTDVRDIVRAYWDIIELGIPGDAYNVCSGYPTSIREIANTLVELSSVPKIKIFETGPPPGPLAIMTQKGECSKLHALSGWSPRISIKKSLQDTLLILRNMSQ